MCQRTGLCWAVWPLCLGVLLAGCARGADTLVLNDGQKVEGTIVEESGDTLVLKVKFGQVKYKKSEIKEIVKAAAAGAAEASELRDVLVLANGDEHRGLLVAETDKEVTFDLLMSGKSVSKTLLSRTTFAKAELKEVKKLTDEQRAAARKYLESVASQAQQDTAAEKEVSLASEVYR
ncbi:MAG: hypothetical protein ABSE73_27050, partial [Planctomycetota bacterium]